MGPNYLTKSIFKSVNCSFHSIKHLDQKVLFSNFESLLWMILWCINSFLTSNNSMVIKPYKVYNTYIYKILFDLSEYSKIAWFNDLFGQIIEAKVTENYFFLLFSLTLAQIIWPNRSLNQFNLDDSDGSNEIL